MIKFVNCSLLIILTSALAEHRISRSRSELFLKFNGDFIVRSYTCLVKFHDGLISFSRDVNKIVENTLSYSIEEPYLNFFENPGYRFWRG